MKLGKFLPNFVETNHILASGVQRFGGISAIRREEETRRRGEKEREGAWA
jgi:hypothetical protein